MTSWWRAPKSRLTRGQVARLPDGIQRPDGELNTDLLPDCDLYRRDAIAKVAGFSNPWRFEKQALADDRFHKHEIRDDDNRLVTCCTHTNSAAAWGARARAENAARSRANLRQGPISFDLMLSETTGPHAQPVRRRSGQAKR